MPLSRAKSWFFTGFWVRLHVVLLPAPKNRKENHFPTPSPLNKTRSASGKRQASTRLWEPSRLSATKDLTRLRSLRFLWLAPSRSHSAVRSCGEGKLPVLRKAFKAASNEETPRPTKSAAPPPVHRQPVVGIFRAAGRPIRPDLAISQVFLIITDW